MVLLSSRLASAKQHGWSHPLGLLVAAASSHLFVEALSDMFVSFPTSCLVIIWCVTDEVVAIR